MWNFASITVKKKKMDASCQPTDAELVLASQKGDKERFNVLVGRYSPRIFNYVRKRISDWHAAEDVTQETFTRAYSSIDKCIRPEGFLAWIYEISRNCINKWIEKNRSKSLPQIEQSDTSPSSILEEEETRVKRVAILASAISSLPEDTRQIIILKYDKGLKCKEIAEKLNKPISSITRILSEAYSKLDIILTPFLKEE